MKQGKTNDLATCPNCHKSLDAFTSGSDYTPLEGDVSVCVYCSSVLEFTEDLMMVFATAETVANVNWGLRGYACVAATDTQGFVIKKRETVYKRDSQIYPLH